MIKFINYENGNLSVNSFRNPNGYSNSCIVDFIEDILNEHRASCYSGDLHEAIDALRDGSLFGRLEIEHGEDAVIGAVESVHAFIESIV